MSISSDLLAWYYRYKRDLPWRNTRDPYKIWLSEIILQQTRVEQGTPYYYRFLERFPDVLSLAEASEEQVLKTWQGLGYYTRARNLHKAAKFIVSQHNGIFPSNFQDILTLPGVGEYTASAIASFAYDLPYAVLDGNVYRVLSRLFNIQTPINSSPAKKQFNELASLILNTKHPADHNQAIMEFGATFCKPSNPPCHKCPLSVHCKAFEIGNVNNLPVKLQKSSIRKRYFNYLFIKHQGHIFLHKRNGNGVWQNLYELPVIETQSDQTAQKVIKSKVWNTLFDQHRPKIIGISEQKVHKLSHQHIVYRIIEIGIPDETTLTLDKKYLKIGTQQAENYPVPKIIENIFREKLEIYHLNKNTT